MEKFFASCPRGLEALLAEDLTAVGVKDLKAIPGGVHFAAEWPKKLDEMSERARLDRGQRRAIEAYLVAMAPR